MNSYLPPTIAPADDLPTPIYQSTQVTETIPTITPVEPEIQYVQQPQIEYVEQPQTEYVEQPQIEYSQSQEVVPATPQREDLTQYYAILDQYGPVQSDDDFLLDGWKQFYPLDDPFFNWQRGNVAPNWKVYNPEDKRSLEVYEGDMLNGMKHGFGRLSTPIYVRLGMWRDDKFTGWGRESRRNGDVLEGKYIDGKVTGKGILKNAKGNLYIWDFVGSRRHGYGELDTNRIHYKGGFYGDRLHGKGIIHYKIEGHDYDGDFWDNEINGKGVFRWTNGDVYDGQLVRGKMNGFGIYTYANGQIYEGNYVNGVKEGKGKLSYPSGLVYEGDFKKGKPRGNATIMSGGRTIPVEFSDGIFYQV